VVTPRDKQVGVNRQVAFRCEVTGNPTPAVFWNRESSEVRGAHDVVGILLLAEKSFYSNLRLVLFSAQKGHSNPACRYTHLRSKCHGFHSWLQKQQDCLQYCLSVQGKPPANVYLVGLMCTIFCFCDLDLDPMTLIYEADLDILKIYFCTKMKSRLSKVRARTRQTDTHT